MKIPLIKTFFLAYTEIFAQILPSSHLKMLDTISYKCQLKLCQIFYKRANPIQFRIFIGIPSPSDRWILIKLLYYYKLVQKPDHTIYSKLVNKCLFINLPIFNQLRQLIHKWIPNVTKHKIRNDDEFTLPKFRANIIKKISKKNVQLLNIFHPFKVINFITSEYIPFYITNIDKIIINYPQIKQRHLQLYYELFYNFGWFDRKSVHRKFCKLCNLLMIKVQHNM